MRGLMRFISKRPQAMLERNMYKGTSMEEIEKHITDIGDSKDTQYSSLNDEDILRQELEYERDYLGESRSYSAERSSFIDNVRDVAGDHIYPTSVTTKITLFDNSVRISHDFDVCTDVSIIVKLKSDIDYTAIISICSDIDVILYRNGYIFNVISLADHAFLSSLNGDDYMITDDELSIPLYIPQLVNKPGDEEIKKSVGSAYAVSLIGRADVDIEVKREGYYIDSDKIFELLNTERYGLNYCANRTTMYRENEYYSVHMKGVTQILIISIPDDDVYIDSVNVSVNGYLPINFTGDTLHKISHMNNTYYCIGLSKRMYDVSDVYDHFSRVKTVGLSNNRAELIVWLEGDNIPMDSVEFLTIGPMYVVY